jgi:hypothetical protein
MTLGVLAIVNADVRPVASGVSLGLALAKPHIAGPMMLWALFTRRARVATAAIAVVTAGFTVYCVRAHVSPVDVVVGYARILLSFYAGADRLIGRTSVRPWWLALAGDQALGDILWSLGSVLLLIVPCRIAMRGRNVADVRAGAGPALLCLWSLLTIYHIGNNLILLLPAFAFLLLVDDPATAWWRRGVASAIQMAMMFDIPVHLASWVPDRGPLFLVVRDFDRVVVLVTFVSVTFLWRRMERMARDGGDPQLTWRRTRSGLAGGQPRETRNAGEHETAISSGFSQTVTVRLKADTAYACEVVSNAAVPHAATSTTTGLIGKSHRCAVRNPAASASDSISPGWNGCS